MVYDKNVIKIKLFGLICDAPAKSFILCTKGHIGFYSCTIEGKYLNLKKKQMHSSFMANI